MNRFVHVAAAALLVAGVSGQAAAQDADEGFIKAPVFLFMPGVVTANAISSPFDAGSGFLLRFQTTIPTATPWFTPVFGTQWTPNGVGGDRNNALAFFYGAVFALLPPSLTNGFLSVSIDPLGVFARGGGGSDPSGIGNKPYGHDFVLEGAVVLGVGQKMFKANSPFAGLSLYFLADQTLTHLPRDANGDRDYFRPTLLYGIALPLAP